MGRMLETFKLGEGQRAPLAAVKPADAAPVQDCVVDWEIGAEVPFVEVGGPNKKVELSPGLMKHPPQAVPKAPHLPVEATPAALTPKSVLLTETKPMTAAFEPYSASTPTPAGISTEIIAYHHPDHPASKDYAGLLDAMRGGVKTSPAKVLLLFGLKQHVGASTVLLNLAVSAAMKQKLRVAVVDAHFQHADLAKRLGQSGSAGLMEVVAGALALEHALVKTGIAGLSLLPAGLLKKPTMLTSEVMTWLTTWLRDRFDLIFIDGPTLQDADELAVQVPHADGIYLVQSRGETSTLSQGAAQLVSQMGGRLSGLIHTHFEI